MAFFSKKDKKELGEIKQDVKSTFSTIGTGIKSMAGSAYNAIQERRAANKAAEDKRRAVYNEAYAKAEKNALRRKAASDVKAKYFSNRAPSYRGETQAARNFLMGEFAPQQGPVRRKQRPQRQPPREMDFW